jgi:hypothetical protein
MFNITAEELQGQQEFLKTNPSEDAVKSNQGYGMATETEFNIDGGQGITQYINKLIRGQIEGKTLC